MEVHVLRKETVHFIKQSCRGIEYKYCILGRYNYKATSNICGYIGTYSGCAGPQYM